jgi:DNA-binding transcriptional LysR family regulator
LSDGELSVYCIRNRYNEDLMTDRLSGIAAFVAVAEQGSFAAATGRLGLSRSAAGKTVARLETRLGVRLFHRTTRSLSLTEDGQAFYERCVRALAELDAAAATLESGRSEPSGRLRISVPVLFGRRCVAPVLIEVARRHPKLEFEISFTDRPVDLVEEGVDLAVRNGALQGSAGLMSRKLASQRMTVCATPAYLAAHGRPSRIEDLAQHEAVIYSRAGSAHHWIFPDGRGGEREITMRGRIRLDDLEAVRDAALAGMGLAWLSCWLIADRLRSGELVRVLDNVPGVVLDSHALWPQAPQLPMRVRTVIDALAARLPAMTG